jgi:hypothetical protein
MRRLFYIGAEPTRDDLTSFVAEHRDWPVARLASITGLSPDTVHGLVEALKP